MKVLLVEDQRELANWMQKGLCEEGFACNCFENGSEALASIQDQSYDAIILDIMLPGRDGLSILRCLRDSGNTVPVILVTARDRPSERIEGRKRRGRAVLCSGSAAELSLTNHRRCTDTAPYPTDLHIIPVTHPEHQLCARGLVRRR